MAERPNGDSYKTELVPYVTIPANPPTLSEIAEVLQNGMQPLFQQLNVDIASCPRLTTAPYNLAGVGLGGNTSIIEYLHRNDNAPWNHITWDIREILTTSCRDSFVIGSSYAAKPHMPHYGHLIMNATYRAPMDLKNESRLIFTERRNGQTTIEKLTDPNQMIAIQGNMFVSEGRAGRVIRVRAKGRKFINTDIITSMQMILYERYRRCENKYVESDMVAVGTIVNTEPRLWAQEQRYNVLIMNATYRAPMDLKNESRLIFAERRNGQTTIEKLTDPNQMKATQGIMFVSEGRAGLVIRVRAKGRKTINTDIITSMQTILYERYKRNENKVVDGVLKMKYGSVACNLMWDDYQEPVLPFYEFIKRQQCPEIYLESDMVAVGTIINYEPKLWTQEQRYDVVGYLSRLCRTQKIIVLEVIILYYLP
ncbi:Ester hydrolase C11orf54 like protein [Trachymyrmex septentrionalis]|uniref:Ester hydrolase C11orf54 like protein n=1 Tax=Trachymyrmex septentrionalis TaxID=34720 RepID=A0A151JZ30_9HYME|nr:Ester hydrolase C11orf54 like protein [Trachymyrmex septentrionalis]